MKVKIKLEKIYVHDEGDGSGTAEPFLWPVFFKIDDDNLKGKYLSDPAKEPIPWNTISWLHAPSGAHNNLRGGADAGDTIGIHKSIGEHTFELNPKLVPPDKAMAGCVVVLLEEDDFPSDSDIIKYYGDFAQDIADTVRKEVKTAFDVSTGISSGSGSTSSLTAASIEAEVASKLKSKFTHWIVNVDDFIGVKFLKWTWDDLLVNSYRKFSYRWDSSTGSEDGNFTIYGEVLATEVPYHVVIYRHRDFKGKAKPLFPGKYDVDDLGIGNDHLSSLKMPLGWKVTLFRHHHFTGETKVFTKTTPYVGDDFNDRTSSIIVEPCAFIYSDPDYNGDQCTLGPGRYDVDDLRNLGIANDAISSLRVPNNWKVTLYLHHHFTGRTKVFTKDTPYVGDDFNNQTSSLIVED